ncbi:TPA: inverse autotransporter beta domain-containing protein [Escherichia coli]|nr:LysM peptidoglycan-binding domain-containing protein [Escherichia coli]EKT6308805.1 inverse autotransporter beta domain-containing protein [Escherichia coli]MDF1079694.1 inverse autotransporter beta domain-containing protein [Escherichia coli]HDQ3788645.1 inverse autotransporter beta domain-containing protein [Escherichia coli]
MNRRENKEQSRVTFRQKRLTHMITAVTLAMQAGLPLAGAFTPVMVQAAEVQAPRSPFAVDRERAAAVDRMQTRPYTLAKGETVADVAKRYNLSVDELRRLNMLRTFANGFDNLKAGDELDVPVQTAAGEKDELAAAREALTQSGQDGERRLAERAAGAAGFLSSKPDSDAARALATSAATGTVNERIADSLKGLKGTYRVGIQADDNLSLKNSSVDALIPLHETKENLYFTQGSLHRTNDRSQANLGVGVRHFTEDNAMVGGNAFLDYDLSRDHARGGVGLEYWRDYLRFGANAYMRLTGWKDSPDIEDYEERPANGFDVRAEGYLPSYPQLGAKVVYEKYFGNKVGLFGNSEDDLQKDPQAVTVGASYTPVPLITASLDHRQGESGKNDTRVGLEVNYQPDKKLSDQLDPEQVRIQRTVQGGRYDLVDRNNNIVLEYRKKEVIRLNMSNPITGRGGDRVSLGLSVNSKYGLSDVVVMSEELVSAGGQINNSGLTSTVTLPAWKADGKNTYTLRAYATDKKGNASKTVESQVVVTAAGINVSDSVVTLTGVSNGKMLADGVSKATLHVELKNETGEPLTGMAKLLTTKLDFVAKGTETGGETAPAAKSRRAQSRITQDVLKADPTVGGFTELPGAPGTYEATFVSGTVAGKVTLTPVLDKVSLASAGVELTDTMADVTNTNLTVTYNNTSNNTVKDALVANNTDTATLTYTVKDENGQAVTGEASRLKFVVLPGQNGVDASRITISDVKETTAGTYTATVKGTQAVKDVKVGVLANTVRVEGVEATLDLAADTKTAAVSEVVPVIGTTYADGASLGVARVTVKDAYGNLVPSVTVTGSKHSGSGNPEYKANDVATDASGQSVVSFFTTDAGDYVMLFKVTGTNGTTDNGQTAKFTFTSVTKSGEAAALMKANNQVVAESSGNTKNIITLQYEAANEAQASSQPQTKATITVTPKNGAGNSDYGLVQKGEVTLKWSGNKATADVDFWSKKKGDYAITIDVTVNGAAKPKTRGVTASFRPDTSDVRITLQNGGDTKVAAGTSRTLTATLKDKYDNLIDDGTLAFSITKKVEGGQEAQLSNPTVTVGSSGTATTSFTPYQAGTSPAENNYTLQAKYTSAADRPVNSGQAATQNYSVIGNVNEPKITVTAGKNNQTTSDGSVYNTATVKLTDTWGNPIAGTVNVSTTKQSGQTCGDAAVKDRSLTFTAAGGSQTANISATQAGDYNAVFTSRPGNKQAQATLGMAFIAKAPELSFASSASEQGIGVGVTLTATVKDAGSAKRCPVPNVPVTFTALPDSSAGANQSSIYHTLSQPSVVTNASGVSQVTLTGQQAWTWKTNASVEVNGQTATKEVSVIGTETANTVNSQYYVVGAPWPVWFGNNSNISNYKDNVSDSSLKTWSNTTTWAATPRINKAWPTSFTFTNQSTKRQLTVTTPRGLTSFKENSINNVKGETKFTAPMVSGMSCNAGNMQDVQWATSALKQAAARGVSLTNLADGLMSPVTAASYKSQILTSGYGVPTWSGTGVVLMNGATGIARSLATKVKATAFSSDARSITSAAWVGAGWLYSHADSAGPNPSGSRYDGGSGRIFSIDSTGWLTEKTGVTNTWVNRQWSSSSGGVCDDIWSNPDNNRPGGTANFALGVSMVRCKYDNGDGANSGNFGGTLTNGLVGTRADGWEIWGNFPKNYPGPTGWYWDNSNMEPGNAHAHFLFPVFCAAWR